MPSAAIARPAPVTVANRTETRRPCQGDMRGWNFELGQFGAA
jgi:hypothetical protein